MRILEQVIQEETFDIEVQYCDPDDCLHDCIHSGSITVMRLLPVGDRSYYGEIKRTVQEEIFEIEVQYCDPDDCLHDCMESGYNNCTAVVTSWW